eukprot:CAMPEP_0169437636 /NCGR_PEP_ID=MMETSP1042-20121227/6235_1 /TAXON_ID=464988 /ORGANISM="Hemiselmis andersenii, Strain CCMP1180" /LENGTH=144 /DNA_ID=CAMNT_0009548425 /DNA_START=24 /DNA_END=455 /DNA_ORIENTATION=+
MVRLVACFVGHLVNDIGVAGTLSHAPAHLVYLQQHLLLTLVSNKLLPHCLELHGIVPDPPHNLAVDVPPILHQSEPHHDQKDGHQGQRVVQHPSGVPSDCRVGDLAEEEAPPTAHEELGEEFLVELHRVDRQHLQRRDKEGPDK